jgi:hypothetical protein
MRSYQSISSSCAKPFFAQKWQQMLFFAAFFNLKADFLAVFLAFFVSLSQPINKKSA